MRLIDADALVSLEEVKRKGCAYIEEINNAPTIDAEPAVRCKDCKYYELNSIESIDGIPLIVAHEICRFWGNGCKTDPSGFCSFGERKDNED